LATFQAPALVNRPRVCVPKQQSAERALSLVEPKHARVNFEKKRLSKILGLPCVADHGVSHPEHLPPIAVEQQKEGFLIPLGHFAAQRFVRQTSKVFRTTWSIPESHLYLSQRFPLSSEGLERAPFQKEHLLPPLPSR
jgi:hypothetical protein